MASVQEPEERPRPASAPPPAPVHRSRTPRKKSPKWRWLLILTVVAITGVVAVRIIQARRADPAEKAGGARGPQGPVPVVAGVVEHADVPIYLDGLGTVQALNTVTVRARIDGEIKDIAFTEGQEVRAGDLLLQIDPAPYQATYDQAVAKKGQDEAQLANAQADLSRYQDLAGKKVISSQQLDTQKALVRQFDAAVKADEAAVAAAKVQLDYTKIVAPIDGRTGIRLVDKGNIVRASDQTGLVVVTQLQPIAILFTLPEQSLSQIDKKVAASGQLQVVAVDRDNKTELERGTLTVIDNQIDTTTGTIKLKATFPNEKFGLWPGQFVNARLLLTVRKDAIVVRNSVVQRGPQGPFIFVIKPDDTVEMRPVAIGPSENGVTIIDQGLQAGERIVVDGQYKLLPNSKVKTADAAAAAAGAGPRLHRNSPQSK
jgi:multidrug efflux system membrane fusion protein